MKYYNKKNLYILINLFMELLNFGCVVNTIGLDYYLNLNM